VEDAMRCSDVRGAAVLIALATAIAASGAATAGTRTYVALAGRDDAIPKLGRPGISVRVEVPDAGDAAAVVAELARELARQVHTRRLAGDEPGDYALAVTLDAPRPEGEGVTIRFTAVLDSAAGERLWRVEGRSDVDGAPVDAAVYAGISRNLVSALIHDGWVQPRYDPDDPPPQAPRVHGEGGGR
jgi:hypothetical protein